MTQKMRTSGPERLAKGEMASRQGSQVVGTEEEIKRIAGRKKGQSTEKRWMLRPDRISKGRWMLSSLLIGEADPASPTSMEA